MAHGAFGYEIDDSKSSFTEALQKVMDTLSKIGIRKESAKLTILRYMKEEVPTNSMGQSSSTTGPIKTVDPLLKRKPLKRLKAFLKR